MNFVAPINSTLQVIAALLAFIAVYLAFVISIIICLVATELISEPTNVFRGCGVGSISLDTRVR
jgi:hypothetical protein